MAAAKFIENTQSSRPDLAAPLGELLELYNRKLYHELTTKLEDAVANPSFQQGDVLVHIYHNFVADVEQKLNKLKVAQIAVAVSSHYTERMSAVAFLEGVAVKLAADGEARAELPVLYLQMHVALLHLQSGALADAKVLTDAAREKLDAASEVDASVFAAFYFAAAQLAKAKRDYADFYRSGLLYLAYVAVGSLPEVTRQELAVDLSLAALLGENVYNFGELLGHTVLQSLQGTQYAWLAEVLMAFNSGDLSAYENLCVKYAAQLNAQPALVAHERLLREKITILALMEIIARLPSDSRNISLQAIAERTKLSVDGVEFLLMKTLSVRLIEGTIDQVDGVVRVSWVQPRVLLLPQVRELQGRLTGWIDKVHATRLALEGEAPELLGAA